MVGLKKFFKRILGIYSPNESYLKKARRSSIHYTIINDLLKLNNVLKWWLLIASLLWCLTSVWSFTKSSTINDLKRENEGLKRQIEVCYEQKDRLDNDVRSCLEFEQNIDKYYTCKEDIYESND